MTHRKTVRTGAPWETKVGYSRAVRVGATIAVSGTTAVGEDGGIVGVGDPYRQAARCFEIIGNGLAAAGAGLGDVIRTRVYVTNIDHWEAIGRAHQEVFADIMPASSMVEVSGLIHPDMLVEIEADAVVADA